MGNWYMLMGNLMNQKKDKGYYLTDKPVNSEW